MITLSFFNKLLSLYFYAIYCECNSFIFRIVQDERKQIAFKSEEHSNFYYLFRVFSLKYHKIQIKKKDIKKRCSVFVVGLGQSQLCPCDASWKFYFLSNNYASHYINCLLCRDSLMQLFISIQITKKHYSNTYTLRLKDLYSYILIQITFFITCVRI